MVKGIETLSGKRAKNTATPKRARKPSTQEIWCNVFPCVNRKFTNKGNKRTHDLAEHTLTVLKYSEKKKVVLPVRKIKKKKTSTKRITGAAVSGAIALENQLHTDRLRDMSKPPVATMGPFNPLFVDDDIMMADSESNENDYERNMESEENLVDEEVGGDIDLDFVYGTNGGGEEVVGGQVLFNNVDDDFTMRVAHLEEYGDLDIPDEFRKYLIWQKGYYAPHLHNGKFNMPPPLDIEFTKMISLLQDLKEADFSDVRMAKINVELMKLTEVCGFSKQNQNNLHDFLLTYVDATHKSELLTPAARNLLAEQSDRKGLKFTTYYPLLGTELANLYQGSEIHMANILDAVIMMLKDPELFGKVVSKHKVWQCRLYTCYQLLVDHLRVYLCVQICTKMHKDAMYA